MLLAPARPSSSLHHTITKTAATGAPDSRDLDHDDPHQHLYHTHDYHHTDTISGDSEHHGHHSRSHSLTLGHWTWAKGGRLFTLNFPERTAKPSKPSSFSSRLRPSLKSVDYNTLAPPDQCGDTTMAAVIEDNVLPEPPDTDIETAPSSPPGLSYSKSSKSSDSSSLSDHESTEKSDSFDDVIIEESSRSSDDDCNLRPEDRPTLKRPPPPRSLSTSAAMSSPPLSQSRRMQYPSLRGHVNGVLRDQSLNLPRGPAFRRQFSNPTSPSYQSQSPHRLPSRSPSPSKPYTPGEAPLSPTSTSSITPRQSFEPKSPGVNGPFHRRPSWQPNRKSVKELEAECDDLDEDVPDGAILENVPISPMPGSVSHFNLAQPKSQSPSPHRTPSYGNLHSANVPRKHKRPSAPSTLPNGQLNPRSPRNSRPLMLPHSMSVPSLHQPYNPKVRSKSWTEDLNDEARALSAALEEFAERNGSSASPTPTKSAPSSPSRPRQPLRSKTSMMDLPALPRGHTMIDPFPISKEKEAVLTRTRPSWLPPKDRKEERRHMKEWEQMMARAAEAEKRRKSREQEQMEEHREQRDSAERIWDQHVLPNWEKVITEPKTRELWWQGITARNRDVVWLKAIGNDLALGSGSYDIALKRARAAEQKLAKATAEERESSPEAAWFSAIERDVQAVYPDLQIFRKGTRHHQALIDVLKAFATYRGDVGYVYGTHLIAGLLCANMRPEEAFVALANMLNRPIPLAFLVHDSAGMARAYELVLGALKYKFTKLHSHLTSPGLDLKPEEFLDPMLRCLFTYNLPVEHVSRVWDIFAFEGDKVLIRAAVAVLGKLESRLYGSKEEILDVIGWKNQKKWDVGSAEEFVKAVREAGKVDPKGGNDVRVVV